MRYLLLFPLVLMLTAAAPLTDSQRERLQNTNDRNTLLDEPALYALLENAQAAPAAEAGAAIPDYAQLLADPASSRGQLFLIEGTLEFVDNNMTLSRSGWQKTRSLILTTTSGQPVFVFLTDPPTLTPEEEGSRMVRERGMQYRIPARFLKLYRNENRAGKMVDFPVFVGRSVTAAQPPVAGRPSNVATPLVVLLVIVMLGLFYFLRRKTSASNKVAEYRRQREQERRALQRLGVDDAPAEDLPEDPVEAMRILTEKEQLAEDGKTRHD